MTAGLEQVSDWPWGPIITTVIGSGVVSVVATQIFQWIGASRDRDRAARLTARKAIGELERYAYEASDMANSWAHYDRLFDEASRPAPWPNVPALQTFDWTGVKRHLFDRAWGFEGEVARARSIVKSYFDVDDDAALSEGADQALRLGLLAWSLAADLRRAYGFAKGDSRLGSDHDFVDWMRSEQAARAKHRDRQLADGEAMLGT